MGSTKYHQKSRSKGNGAWQLQEAKACFSEVVRRAQERPQRVTVHGKEAAVVVSLSDYEKMYPKTGRDLDELMAASPLADLEFGEGRGPMPVREVEL